MPQRWMLLEGGDNRNNPNVTTSRRRATTRDNKQSSLTTNAHVADINTDRLETTRVLHLVRNAGHVARRDILRQCAGQNMSTKSEQFPSVHETRLLYSLKTLTQLRGRHFRSWARRLSSSLTLAQIRTRVNHV